MQQLGAAGEMRAYSVLGYMTEHGQGLPADPEQAMAYYQKAANAGFVPGQYNLAHMYASYRHDPKTAAALIQQLADKKDASAEYLLGLLYGTGHGEPRDRAKGAEWQKAAIADGFTPTRKIILIFAHDFDLPTTGNAGDGVSPILKDNTKSENALEDKLLDRIPALGGRGNANCSLRRRDTEASICN